MSEHHQVRATDKLFDDLAGNKVKLVASFFGQVATTYFGNKIHNKEFYGKPYFSKKQVAAGALLLLPMAYRFSRKLGRD